MGRGRKGKKAAAVASHDDSGEEEKIPAKRRGRPQKILKDEIFEEEEAEKIDGEEDYVEHSKNSILNNKENKTLISPGKRKRNLQVKDSLQDSVKVENGTTDSIKPVGFRQNGSRRKNKPRRAAEVGVECK